MTFFMDEASKYAVNFGLKTPFFTDNFHLPIKNARAVCLSIIITEFGLTIAKRLADTW